MAENKPLEVQEEKELVGKGEKTVPARYYQPNTDIRETEDALLVVMEVPGVDRKDIEIKVEEDTLRVEARIDHSKYDGMEPLYTEYNVGHFARQFALSHMIDQQQIGAALSDGVLTLTLKKVQQAKPRRIEIGWVEACGVLFEFDSKALQWLANRGYDPVYGARPLKRVIQRSLQNPLATQILEGRVKDGETVKVGVEGGELPVGGQRVMSEAADD